MAGSASTAPAAAFSIKSLFRCISTGIERKFSVPLITSLTSVLATHPTASPTFGMYQWNNAKKTLKIELTGIQLN